MVKKKKPIKRKKKRRGGKKRRRIRIRVSNWFIAAVLAVVALFLIWTYVPRVNNAAISTGAAVPRGAYCYGIDISHYQPTVRWDSLRVLTTSGKRTTNSKSLAKEIRPVSFVFIKATEGASGKDKHFRKHWKNAGHSGIRRGAYHFFRSSKDPKVQAENFIRTVGKISSHDLPPVLDIETMHRGCSHKLLNDRALIWLKTVEKHYGRKPIVYSSASYINNVLCKEIVDNYPIWVAHYKVGHPRCEKWHIWQFAEDAIVYGIDGEVDLNVASERMLRTL